MKERSAGVQPGAGGSIMYPVSDGSSACRLQRVASNWVEGGRTPHGEQSSEAQSLLRSQELRNAKTLRAAPKELQSLTPRYDAIRRRMMKAEDFMPAAHWL